jgi:hypothetical protein
MKFVYYTNITFSAVIDTENRIGELIMNKRNKP